MWCGPGQVGLEVTALRPRRAVWTTSLLAPAPFCHEGLLLAVAAGGPPLCLPFRIQEDPGGGHPKRHVRALPTAPHLSVSGTRPTTQLGGSEQRGADL